ncbi:MAG: cupin domain-containing protein [Sulfuricellaceae bacterium]
MNTRFLKLEFFLTLLCAVVTPVQAEGYVGAVKAEKILVTTTAGNGQKHVYLKTERPEVTAMIVEIPPSVETGWHLHTVPVYAYVLAGTLEVEISGDKTLVFKPGEAIVEVQNLAHNGKNRGSETVKLAVFYTGEEGRPNVIRVEKPETGGNGR